MPLPGIELTCVGLFAGMLGSLEVGRRIGLRILRVHGESSGTIFPALETAVFGLMALLVGFSFAGAAGRYEMKRALIVKESNAIGTAWLRIDLLPWQRQHALREGFRRYLDSRLEFYRDIRNEKAAQQALVRAANLQSQIWSNAVVACAEASSVATTTLVIASLNEMFDIRTERIAAVKAQSPSLIRALLLFVPLICSLLAGMNLASRSHRSWVHILGFAAIISFSVYVVLDFDSPRTGMIRLDMFDQTMLDLRSEMQQIQ